MSTLPLRVAALCLGLAACDGGQLGSPRVAIVLPVDASVIVGPQIALSGTVVDPDGPADVLQVTWSSSLDGQLVTGADALPVDNYSEVTVELSLGEHTLTLLAQDAAGTTRSASVQVTVDERPDPDSDSAD